MAGMSVADAEKMCGLSMDEVMNISKNSQTPMEKEANDIWQKLDHMASTDKAGYDKYVKDQIAEGKEFFKKYPDGKVPEPQPRIPISKFWVETEVVDASGRPVKPAAPRFFNVCESDAIEYTDDKNLNIFMSEVVDKQIDCVIHPKFMAKCLDDNLFLHDTIQMLFDTYTAEHKEKEKVKHTYEHHGDPRTLVMKVPKAKSKDESKDTAMDILSKVRHSEKAKQLVEDDRENVAKRLFSMYGGADGKAAAAADPPTSFDFDQKQKVKPKKAVEIKEILSHTMDQNADGSIIVKVELPEGTPVADVDLEIEDDKKLLVAVPKSDTLEIALPRKVQDYTAKYFKGKRVLKITLS